MCSDVYSGSQAFSEKESQAVETFIMNNRQNMMAYLTYHSYGQMWLYPWGFTSSLPSDWQELVSSIFMLDRAALRKQNPGGKGAPGG